MAFTSVLQMYLDWANSLLCEHGIVINELKEFQDGRIFSLLIEILTGTQLLPSSEDCDDDEVSSLDRVQTILDYLTGLGIKLKVSASGVLKGELKSILDVIWAIILNFTVHSPDAPMQQKTVRSGKKQLIQWCAAQLGETSLDTCKGLAQCFEKNNKLAELIGLFCSYANNSTETYVNNLTSALIASEEHFGITKSLLSPADVISGTVEEHALTIYLALLRRKVTQLATDNDQLEKSSDLNTSAGMPEGLTEEVANSLSQTFSFKFMRSPSVSPTKPRPSSTTHHTPPSHDAVTVEGDNAQPVVRKKTTPLPSKIPVSSARVNQPSPSTMEEVTPIPESSPRKRHQETADEQKQTTSATDKGFKMPSGIPVSSARVNQPSPSTMEEVAPIPESSSRKRHQETADEQKQTASSTDKGFKMPSGIPVRKNQKLSSIKPVQTSTPNSKQKQSSERNKQRIDVGVERHDIEDDGKTMHSGGVARREMEQGVPDDQSRTKEAEARVELDLSDIEQEDEVNKEEQEKGMKGGVAMGDKTKSVGESTNARMQDNEQIIRTEKKAIRAEAVNHTEGQRLREDKKSEDHEEEGTKEREKVEVKVSSRICAFAREDGDGERATEEQATRGRTQDDERKMKTETESSVEKSSLLRRGEELSFMIPKGLDLSGSRGDELLSMLEAIGTEGKQLRQELNEAKAREDFLTKKLNERFSSQEEEVINRLVGELEMLRRENQRLFKELARARESGAEDRKRCENLQAAVERLEMDVERLTAENFRLKFAADTGYQVTGDDLLAAMSEADTGFQSLPSPGKEFSHPDFQESVPSPILEAQSEHETRLLAMKTETESMRKLQELLTKAHTENRRLKALQQHPESNTDHEVAMAKVKAELGLAQVEGERLREERAQLKKEVKEGRQQTKEQMQKYKELEAMMVKYSREERDSRRDAVGHGVDRTQGYDKIQKGKSTDILKSSQSSSGQSEQNVRKSQMEAFSYKPEAVNKSNSTSSENSVNVTRPASEGIHKNICSKSADDNLQDRDSWVLDSDEDRRKVDVKATVPKDQQVSTAFVVKNDGRGYKQELPRSKDPLALPLTSAYAGSDRAMSTDGEDDKQNVQNNPGGTPEAVVDWKYLAMSPSPDNELRTIAQYVARPSDLETASEIESETESRTSDLFMSSNVSSPIGRLLSTQDRRSSLGGLIVARAQTSPADDQEHSSVFPEDSQIKDDTLIDESYLTTSQAYVTADENSVGRTSAIKQGNTTYDATDSNKPVVKEEGLTPYYTPMVQRSKLQFSSLSSSLESLRSISRKARDDIDAEGSNIDSVSKKEAPKMEQNVPTLEVERKWIQEELGRIRLDNNIPGEKYSDLGRRLNADKQFGSTMLSSSREDLQFMPPRNVPRWRKFQFRSRSSRPSEASQPSSYQSTVLSNGADFRRSPTRTVSLTRLNVSDGAGDDSVKTSPTYGLKTSPTYRSNTSPERSFVQHAVYPLRSSSDDMSDEFKPLPNELRKPHILTERTPVKPNKGTVPNQRADALPVRSLPPTHPITAGSDNQREPTNASSSIRNKHLPVAKGNISEDKTFSDPSILPILPDSASPPKFRELSSSATGTDNNVTLNSAYRISTTTLGEVPSISQHTKTSSHSPHTMLLPNPPQRTDISVSEPISDLPNSYPDKSGGSGGISSTLTSDDLNTLAEKIIQEADSGVSLTSSLDIRNGLPKSMYEHRLLSRDEQTYANSLIAKYIDNSPDKF